MPPSTPTDDNPSPRLSSDSVYFSGEDDYAPHETVIFHGTDTSAEALKVLQSHTAEARHTSIAVSRQGICTPGTRTTTLSKLESLATSSDPSSPDVIWMHGPAGAGKSVIMRTFANMLENQGLLLASFFFSGTDPQRNTSRRFIPTLAAQAWAALPVTRENITDAIQNTPDLFSRPAHRQSSFLLEKPLLAGLASVDTPLVIIVDGLDECTEGAGRIGIVKAMVQLASNIRARVNGRVKIFIASRTEHKIQSTFDKLTSKASNKSELDVPISVVGLDDSDTNIHRVYEEQFRRIREKFKLPPSWPSQEEIKWLMGKTSGQYSFVSVSTGFMYGGHPERRLKVIQEILKGDNLRPFEALDQLYATIFAELPEDMRLPAVSILRCRLHPLWSLELNAILEPLLQLPTGYTDGLSPYLASLIDFDHDMEPYHASLVDFLVNPSRSGKFSLYIDDGTLSRAIQRGMLAMFIGQQPALSEYYTSQKVELRLMQFLEGPGRDFTDNAIVPNPLPTAELTSALNKIDVPSLSSGRSMCLVSFLELLQRQFQPKYLWILNPALWLTIWYTLPWRINRKTDSYD